MTATTIVPRKHRKHDITPKDLEEFGLRVKFTHYRLTEKDAKKLTDRLINQDSLLKTGKQLSEEFQNLSNEEKRHYIKSTGGKTICDIILLKDKEIIATGQSVCHPECDAYNKQRGRLKAFGKAIRNLKNRLRIDGNTGWFELYENILTYYKVDSIRPKLNPRKKRYTADKIKKIISEMEQDIINNGGCIDDIMTSCFIDDLLNQLDN